MPQKDLSGSTRSDSWPDRTQEPWPVTVTAHSHSLKLQRLANSEAQKPDSNLLPHSLLHESNSIRFFWLASLSHQAISLQKRKTRQQNGSVLSTPQVRPHLFILSSRVFLHGWSISSIYLPLLIHKSLRGLLLRHRRQNRARGGKGGSDENQRWTRDNAVIVHNRQKPRKWHGKERDAVWKATETLSQLGV